jgi:phage gp46-like protein
MDLKIDFDESNQIDLLFDANDLKTEDGLRTALIISLFTEARVETNEIPPGESDPAGWWGDAFPDVDGDAIGSRLWLLRREKNTAETRARAEEYARAALKWLIEDGIVSAIDVTVTKESREQALIAVRISRPSQTDVNMRFSFAWGE